MTSSLLLSALAMGLVFAAGTAAGDPASVGASGQCYDAAGNGGDDEVRASADTGDPGSTSVTPLSGTGAAMAAAEFAMGEAANPGGDGCSNADTLDYVEADASVGGMGAQVCFDGSVRTDGACPTSPAGPGGPG